MLLALDVRLARVALRVERIELLFEAFLGRFPGVDRAPERAMRDPGVCLDEIAIAIGVKGGNIKIILVESEQEVRPPATVGHIQWLDMHDWKSGHGTVQIAKGQPAVGDESWERWYRSSLDEIVTVLKATRAVALPAKLKRSPAI